MKKSLLLFLFAHQLAFSQWNQVYNVNNGSSNSILCLDYNADGSIFFGRHGALNYSLNNGTSWSTFSGQSSVCSGLTSPYYQVVSFLSKDTGLFGGRDNSGGGYNFCAGTSSGFSTNFCTKPLTAANYADVFYLHHFSKDTVLVIDNNFNSKLSVNGGATWSSNSIPNISQYVLGCNAAAKGGVIYYFGSSFYKTSNYGSSYSNSAPLFGNYDYLSASFVDAQNGFLLVRDKSTSEKTLYKTNNGGGNWNQVMPGTTTEPLSQIQFLSVDTGYMIGGNGVFRTTDGGVTWGVQRFSGVVFQQLKFVTGQIGAVAGYKGVNSLVYNTSNGGGAYRPFAYSYLGNAACCANVLCNLFNGGANYYSYQWYLDGSLISSAYTPSPITATAGTHTLELISSYLGQSDTTYRSIYSAPALTSSLTCALWDSTICVGATTTVSVNSSVTGFTYQLLDGGSSVSTPYGGNGGTVNLTSFPVNHSYTMTVQGQSPYYYCPGNTLTKNFNITALPLPPDTLLSLSQDSVCLSQTFSATLLNSDPLATYTLSGGYYNVPANTLATYSNSASNYSYTSPGMSVSWYVYYRAQGSNGCVLNTSTKHFVKVDSIYSIIGSAVPDVYTGDTIKVYNKSISYSNYWQITPTPDAVDTSVASRGFFAFNTPGSKMIRLFSSNKTGCLDTSSLAINVFGHAPAAPGTLCKTFSANEPMPQLICFVRPRAKMHVDIKGNYYLYTWRYLGTNPSGGSSGIYQFFLNKYDRNGNLKWTVTPTYISPGYDYQSSTVSAIQSDTLGNIYILGNYSAKTFQIGTVSITNSNFNGRAFIAKLDTFGNAIWINNITNNSTAGINASDLTVPNYDNVIHNRTNYSDWVSGNGSSIKSLAIPFPIFDAFGFINQCSTYSNEDISHNPKLLVVGDKVISFSLHSSGSGSIYLPNNTYYAVNSISGVVSISDTAGHFIKVFKVFDVKGPNVNPYTQTYINDMQVTFTKDQNSHLYLSYSPYEFEIKDSISHITNDLDYVIPQVGTLKGKGQTSIIEKFDTSGTLLYYNLTNVNVRGMAVNGQGDLYGIGNYNLGAQFDSQDGNNVGLIDKDGTQNAILFCYDSLGNIRWAEPVRSPDVDVAETLVSTNKCDPNVYFLMSSKGALRFMNDTASFSNKYSFYKYTPVNDCAPVNSCAWSVWSNARLVNVAEGKKIDRMIHVYPNPFKDEVRIECKGAEIKSVWIENSFGQLVAKENVVKSCADLKLDLRGIPSGVYYLKVMSPDGNIGVERLIKAF